MKPVNCAKQAMYGTASFHHHSLLPPPSHAGHQDCDDDDDDDDAGVICCATYGWMVGVVGWQHQLFEHLKFVFFVFFPFPCYLNAMTTYVEN